MQALMRLVLVCLPAAPAFAADAECAVTVVAQGVRDDTGVVGTLLFASAEGWPQGFDRALQRQAVDARPGEVEIVFRGIEPGRYGIVALHDEDEDRKMDKNFFGLPKEGWGMSNNPKPRFSAPDFAAAAADLTCGDRVEIRLRY